MADALEQIVELKLGIHPEAAVSGAVLFQTEVSTILTFNAIRPTARLTPEGVPYLSEAGTAVFKFRRCFVTRFGYPNDEARWGIPSYKGVSYGIYEILKSNWIASVVEMNRHQFPDTKDDFVAHHYLFTFHDSTFECLADGFEFEVTDESYETILRRISDGLF